MSNALVLSHTSVIGADIALPPVPWRDPHTVSPAELSTYIQSLEQACLNNPQSADLRTCLGMAYAVNLDVDKSMEALETATSIDPENFWAQFKYAELQCFRTLANAEDAASRRSSSQTIGTTIWRANSCRKSAAAPRGEGRDLEQVALHPRCPSAMLLVIF